MYKIIFFKVCVYQLPCRIQRYIFSETDKGKLNFFKKVKILLRHDFIDYIFISLVFNMLILAV